MKDVVLLVDDDAQVLHVLSRHLRDEPCQVYTARSGEEAIDLLKAHDVHVVVSDERMPAMQGTELLAWIAEHYPETVRLMLTGCSSLESALRAINEGRVYRFLTKPCGQAEWLTAVREALAQHARLREHRLLMEGNRREASDLERRRADLAIADRILERDLRRPAEELRHSLCSLSERYHDVFDATLQRTIADILEALGEVERLVHGALPAEMAADCRTNGARQD